MRLINKVITIQTIFFLYVLAYCFATLASPEASLAKYMAHITGSYDLPLNILKLSIPFALVGLFRKFTPIRMWICLLPFICYCGLSAYAITGYPTPSATGFVNCIFFIAISIALTWERING